MDFCLKVLMNFVLFTFVIQDKTCIADEQGVISQLFALASQSKLDSYYSYYRIR